MAEPADHRALGRCRGTALVASSPKVEIQEAGDPGTLLRPASRREAEVGAGRHHSLVGDHADGALESPTGRRLRGWQVETMVLSYGPESTSRRGQCHVRQPEAAQEPGGFPGMPARTPAENPGP